MREAAMTVWCAAAVALLGGCTPPRDCGVFDMRRDATGRCRPFLTCGEDGPEDLSGLASCANPCAARGARDCELDPRCQVVKRSTDGSFMLCRAVAEQRACEELSVEQCDRAGCTLAAPAAVCPPESPRLDASGGLMPRACRPSAGAPLRVCVTQSCLGLPQSACSARGGCAWAGGLCAPALPLACSKLKEPECLKRRDCNPTGFASYCPAGAECVGQSQSTYGFDKCVPAATPARACLASADCPPDHSCQVKCSGPVSSCHGTCVARTGCGGLDEAACTRAAACAPSYGEQCGAAYYGPASCVPGFTGCVDVARGSIVVDRSVLVTDPELLDQERYQFPEMMARLGVSAAMVDAMLVTLTRDTMVGGRLAAARPGFASWYAKRSRVAGVLDLEGLHLRPQAIVNRIDLMGRGACGEARVVYANDSGASDAFQRINLILEFAVPDDGEGCASVGRAWAALSALAAADPMLALRLGELTDRLFVRERLAQVRSNERVAGGTMVKDWELREFALAASGDGFEPRPCKATPHAGAGDDPAFLGWATANQIGLRSGEVEVPELFLAPASRTSALLALPPPLSSLAGDLSKNTCQGCHSVDTGALFVHLAQRRHADTRAAPSDFLKAELDRRAELLRVLVDPGTPQGLLMAMPRPVAPH